MARYTGAVCRLCRREDMKLFLKGERCYTDKCGYERRAYPPGQHGQSRRRKRSDYGEQLREKQKVKRIYGIAEKQFRGYYYKALRTKGVSGNGSGPVTEGPVVGGGAAVPHANPPDAPGARTWVKLPPR